MKLALQTGVELSWMKRKMWMLLDDVRLSVWRRRNEHFLNVELIV
jgi:hypothetical protein